MVGRVPVDFALTYALGRESTDNSCSGIESSIEPFGGKIYNDKVGFVFDAIDRLNRQIKSLGFGIKVD